MAVYMIVETKVTDKEVFSQYGEEFDEMLKKYGGRFLVRGGEVTPLSGNWNPERIAVIEFESFEQLMNCFVSADYLEIAALRESSTISKAIVVRGCRSSLKG
jgi:uncharacterized protein (DUF1330 family)